MYNVWTFTKIIKLFTQITEDSHDNDNNNNQCYYSFCVFKGQECLEDKSMVEFSLYSFRFEWWKEIWFEASENDRIILIMLTPIYIYIYIHDTCIRKIKI